jgi:hypothetical protein
MGMCLASLSQMALKAIDAFQSLRSLFFIRITFV